MKGCISYSLFGLNQNVQNSFEFHTYLRGLWVNARVNRVLYPGWDIAVHTERYIYEAFQPVLDWLSSRGIIYTSFPPHANVPLCKKMLWRMYPAFDSNYTHVLCRDTDSVGTFRERQAVQEWVNEDKTIHCITDSISHNIAMMGGMIGVRPSHFMMRMKINSWDELMKLAGSADFSQKGSDQDFLNSKIYPRMADSATEHFILGMKQTIPEGGGRHYAIPDIPIDGVDPVHRSLNDCAGHIGAAGYYEPPMVRWLNTIDPYRDEYEEIEKQFPQLFFWRQ